MKPRKKVKEQKERKNRQPKKLTGRDGVLTNSEQDKLLERKGEKKKEKKFRFRNNEVSVLVVLVLLLQHPVMVLV
jgi:hypothetical protein